jgi:hypothetical protein
VLSVDFAGWSLAWADGRRDVWYWLSARELTLLRLSRGVSDGPLKLAPSFVGPSPSTSTILSSSVSSLSWPTRSRSPFSLRAVSSRPGANRGEFSFWAVGVDSLVPVMFCRSALEVLWTLECVLTGLNIEGSSCLRDFAGSMFGVEDNRVRVVASEALKGTFESREGGRTSGKVAVAGDCSLDDGTDTTTGDETAVPPGLRFTAAALDAGDVPALGPSCGCSLTPPTEARRRLYSPLRPPCTRSMPLDSPTLDGAGGGLKSSKVVSVSERDAVACIWWRDSCSDPRRESLAMAIAVGTMCGCGGTWRAYRGRGASTAISDG